MSKEKTDIEPSKKLLKQCRDNKEKAIRQLYKMCFSYLMHVCFKFYGDKERSEAILNMGFMRILTNLEKYEHGRSFRNWIHSIMVNVLIDEERRNKRWNERIRVLEEHQMDGAHVSNQGEINLDESDVLVLLNELNDKERVIFSLYAIEEWTHSEICEELNISRSLSKWYVHQARKKLMKTIERKKRLSQYHGSYR